MENKKLNSFFGKRLRDELCFAWDSIMDNAQEIRLRVNRPIAIRKNGVDMFINKDRGFSIDGRNGIIAEKEDIEQVVSMVCGYSPYAFVDELRNGYITIEGGHRVGITGKTVVENGSIKTIKDINGINIRLAKEVKNCGVGIIKYIAGDKSVHNTLIVSPPCCGKTTLLRDIIRLLSDEYGLNVGVADERGELAACYLGVPQNDIGLRTDVLDCCPKAAGMMMLIRTMSPRVVAADEIGSAEDIKAIEEAVATGVFVICTAHGTSIDDVKRRPVLNKLIELHTFSRYVVLSHENGAGSVCGIYDGDLNNLLLQDKGG